MKIRFITFFNNNNKKSVYIFSAALIKLSNVRCKIALFHKLHCFVHIQSVLPLYNAGKARYCPIGAHKAAGQKCKYWSRQKNSIFPLHLQLLLNLTIFYKNVCFQKGFITSGHGQILQRILLAWQEVLRNSWAVHVRPSMLDRV